MPLELYHYSSFERSVRALGYEHQEIVRRILRALSVYYASNCDLVQAQKIEPCFFYKQLRKPYYEAGMEGAVRIIIERCGSECYAILAGNHDQVKKFLANH